MKKRCNGFTRIILMMVLAFLVILPCFGEKMARDVNGAPIQFARTFTAVRDSIPAQAPAVYDSLAVPNNAIECTVIFTTQPGMVYFGAAKTLAATAADWLIVPKEKEFTFPVMEGVTYIKYKSLTGANAINIIWKRM